MNPRTPTSRDDRSALLETRFHQSAVAILSLTAAAKGISAFGSQSILDKSDPIFWVLKNRELLLLVGALEMGVALLLISKVSPSIKRGSLLWLCINFLLYRVGLWIIGAPATCKCLGDLAERIGLSDSQASWLLLGVLGYLLAGSLVFLRRSRSGPSFPDLRQDGHDDSRIQAH